MLGTIILIIIIMKKYYNIESISFLNETLQLKVDNNLYQIELKLVSPILLKASTEERLNYKLSPGNYGIHWPLINEDLSIKKLISL